MIRLRRESKPVFLKNKSDESDAKGVWIGGDHPIAVQSMTTTDTADVDTTLEQVYGAIAFYLAHREDVDRYLETGRHEFETAREAARNADPMFYLKLVDAKGVSRLYQPRPGLTPLLVVIAAGLIAMIAVIWLTPALRDVAELLWLRLQMLFGSSG